MRLYDRYYGLKESIISSTFGWLASALLPPCHIAILWYFWSKYNVYINRYQCTCSCWDTVFKGPYEKGVAAYKHMYFNATVETFKIWVIIVTGIVCLYECIRYITTLMLNMKLRFSMAVLFLSSIFPHYYSWWTYINYHNDNYFEQYNHQMFFTATEIISTTIVLHLANEKNEITHRKIFVIIGISVLHIYASGIDQFFVNIFRGKGFAHQVVRDFGFMVPDILHTIIPVYELLRTRRITLEEKMWYREKHLKTDVYKLIVLTLIGSVMVQYI